MRTVVGCANFRHRSRCWWQVTNNPWKHHTSANDMWMYNSTRKYCWLTATVSFHGVSVAAERMKTVKSTHGTIASRLTRNFKLWKTSNWLFLFKSWAPIQMTNRPGNIPLTKKAKYKTFYCSLDSAGWIVGCWSRIRWLTLSVVSSSK